MILQFNTRHDLQSQLWYQYLEKRNLSATSPADHYDTCIIGIVATTNLIL